MFHEFHVIDKASKDKVKTGSTSCVKNLLLLPAKKIVMQALSVVDCPVELQLLLVLVKVIWSKRPSHACVETHASHVMAGMVCG